MAYNKKIILFLLSSLHLFVGCSGTSSTMNTFKGSSDYYKHHAADILKESIDDSIKHESNLGAPPGFSDRAYSKANWNTYWNRRIPYIYNVENESDAYEGPTGQEFVSYLIEQRRIKNLPPIDLSESNKKILYGGQGK